MNIRRALPVLWFTVPLGVFAVYAPIPEHEQGKPVTYSLTAGISHDSNIFGAPTDRIDSIVYRVSPKVAINASATDQTFVSANYGLDMDHMEDRPGSKTLFSHRLGARVAHSFSPATNIDISDTYTLSRNPESLLAGVPLNTDQSFHNNQFNVRFETKPGEKSDVVVKYRNMLFDFRTQALSDELDRMEHLFGLELGYSFLPETRFDVEYRYQDIGYDTDGALKDKQSHFFLAGVAHDVGPRLSLVGKAGIEDRSRSNAANVTAPYAEVGGTFDYAPQSYLSAGFARTFEEPSNFSLYTDTRVNRVFANAKHSFNDNFVLSGSLIYEFNKLNRQAAVGGGRFSEDVIRTGLAATYFYNRNLSIIATVDYDRVWSADSTRELIRRRGGISARLTF